MDEIQKNVISSSLCRGGALAALNGHYEDAISIFSKVIDKLPDHPEAYHLRAAAYSELKEYEKAIVDCAKAIELNPYSRDYYSLRADIYLKCNKCDEAWEDYYRGVKEGWTFSAAWIEKLKKASGRNK